jgi:cobalt-zinc-cadmium efflux system outer membrane protein
VLFLKFECEPSPRDGAPTFTHIASAAAAFVWLMLSSETVLAQPLSDELQFGDVLTVESLITAVRSRSPRLIASEAAAEAASHRLDYAGALDDPVLSYLAAPNASDNSIDLSQRLPWPGTRSAREAVAEEELAVAEWGVVSERLTLETLAKSAYADWYFVDRALEIHEETEARLDQMIAAAEAQYVAGRTSRQDVLQAEVERADFEKHRLQLHRQQVSTLARLNALMDRSPEASLPQAAPITVQPLMMDEAELNRLALEGHPELHRLQAQVARAESLEVVAEKAFYPDFQLRAGYNTLWEDPDKRAVIGVSINMPIGRAKREAALDRASAESRQASGMLADARAGLLAELARAHADVIEVIAVVELHEDELVPLANEYVDAALADYRSGTGAFLNVITAERRFLSAQLDLERARAEYLRRIAALERWVGVPIDSSVSAGN